MPLNSTAPCTSCGAPSYALGRCRRCYQREYMQRRRAGANRALPVRPERCVDCGSAEDYCALGRCRRCYERAAALAHPQRGAMAARRYRAKHPERVRNQRTAHEATRRVRDEIRGTWRNRNRERVLKREAIYRETRRHLDSARGSAWYAAHRDCVRARVRSQRIAHPELFAARGRAYRLAHADRVRESTRQRRAQLRNAFVASVDWRAIWQRDHGRCQMCGKAVPFEQMGRDHIWPLSKGGTHEPRNAQTLCRRCNLMKNNRGPGQLRLL